MLVEFELPNLVRPGHRDVKFAVDILAHSFDELRRDVFERIEEFQDLAGNPLATSDSWSRTITFLKEHTK